MNEYRTLSDDLRDFIEVVAALLIGAAVFAGCYASAAEPLDGGVDRPVLDVRYARVTTADGGIFEVTGGAWLSDAVLIARASDLVTAQAELDAARRAPRAPPSTALMVLTNVTTGLVQTFAAFGTTCLAATGNVFCLKPSP